MPVPLELRFSLSEDFVRLLISTCERLRFKLLCERLLGRVVAESDCGNLTSLVARRCGTGR
jgi:hypothetical protein